MKKVLILSFVLIFSLFGVLPAAATEDGSENIEYCEGTLAFDYSKYKDKGLEINVYNWGEYISDGKEGTVDVNKEFERLTNIKVNYTMYTSNEDLYSKLKGGGSSYDVIIPSDYMIARFIREEMLEQLNFSNIPNYSFIDSKYKNLYYDKENKFSVPYTSGMIGVIYNKTIVEGTPDSWNLMWDPKYKGEILNYNNPRDAFATAQFLLNQNVNTTEEADWQAAFDKLVEQKPLVQGYVMDEVFSKMETGEAAISSYYAGDFFTMYEENNDLEFYYPKEGTNIFVDAMCIPKGSKNKELAELYINFMLDPYIGVANAEQLCYASPNTEVVKDADYRSFLDELHPKAYELLYVQEEGYNTQYYYDLPPATLEKMNTLWESMKTSNNSGYGLYIAAGVVVALIIAAVIVSKIKKHKRENA